MDPIANMFSAIKNAQALGKEFVEVPGSKLKLEITRVLKEEGFIKDYKEVGKPPKLRIFLKYRGNQPIITEIERVSKPGRRIYVKSKKIPLVLRGFGISILSTPKGVMTGKEAKEKGVGGELICKVW